MREQCVLRKLTECLSSYSSITSAMMVMFLSLTVSGCVGNVHYSCDLNQNQSTVIKLYYDVTHHICCILLSQQLLCHRVCFKQQAMKAIRDSMQRSHQTSENKLLCLVSYRWQRPNIANDLRFYLFIYLIKMQRAIWPLTSFKNIQSISYS